MSNNMLGAQARAAEYNAARAATARQQASKDADEQYLPKPAAVPLGAFVTPANRNKGAKTFKPLVLSDEDPIDIQAPPYISEENEHSPSPQSRLTDPPRSASLPPQNKAHITQAEILRSRLQTPFQYLDPSSNASIPSAPRAVLQEDGYGFPPQHSVLSYPQHFGGYHMYIPGPPQVSQHSIHGRYPSPRKKTDNLCTVAELPNMTTFTPVPRAPTVPPATAPPFRPRLLHQSSAEPQLPSQTPQPPQTPSPPNMQGDIELGGPRLHAFGPDDLSPTKFEIKEAYRAKMAREDEEFLIMQRLQAESMLSQTPVPPLRMQAEEGIVRHLQHPLRNKVEEDMIRNLHGSTSEPPTLARRKTSVSVIELMIDSNSVAPPRPQTGVQLRRASVLDQYASPNVQGRLPAEALYQNRPREPLELGEAFCTPTRTQNMLRHASVTSDVDVRQMLLDAFKSSKQVPKSCSHEDTSSSDISDQPNGTQRSSQDAPGRRRDSGLGSSIEIENVTDIPFPLRGVRDRASHDCRVADPAEEEEWLQTISKLKCASIIDKWYAAEPDRSDYADDELASLARWTELNRREHEKRQDKIEAIAAEMRQKWQHGGAFRAPSMNETDAAKHAATVKAVGSIMATLDIQRRDTTGFFHRGSRPYRPAMEHEVDKNAGKSGKPFSMFATGNEVVQRTPVRLAGPGTLQTQLGDTEQLESGRIPRMFVARRFAQGEGGAEDGFTLERMI